MSNTIEEVRVLLAGRKGKLYLSHDAEGNGFQEFGSYAQLTNGDIVLFPNDVDSTEEVEAKFS